MSCAWCKGPIPHCARRDSVYCGTPCRKSAWRFRQGLVAHEAAERPLRFAYADPPYPGLAERYYRDHPDYGGEVDHAALLARLVGYDGWALSTSARALPDVLRLCPPETRVAAWFRGSRGVPSRWPLPGWEPVLYAGGRRVVSEHPVSDALAHWSKPRTSDPDRVIGAKPSAFCWWLFDLLGARPGDELDDLFPGSGGVGRAWRLFQVSRLEPGDASLLQEEDSSRHPGVDPFPKALDDPSPPGARDTSRAAQADASCRALRDVSREYSMDASPNPRGDASPSAAEDASCRTCGTDRR